MGLKLRRRSVYIGTIVAILAMIGGLALASLGNFSTVNSNQNTVSSTLGTTVWNTATSALSPAFTTATVTCQTSPSFSGTAPTTQSGCISVATNLAESSVSGSNHFVEEFTFTLAVTTSTPSACVSTAVCSDTFDTTFSTSTGNGAVSFTVTLTDPTLSTGSDILNIYLDFGTSAPTSITVMYVVATGS